MSLVLGKEKAGDLSNFQDSLVYRAADQPGLHSDPVSATITTKYPLLKMLVSESEVPFKESEMSSNLKSPDMWLEAWHYPEKPEIRTQGSPDTVHTSTDKEPALG